MITYTEGPLPSIQLYPPYENIDETQILDKLFRKKKDNLPIYI